MNFIGGKRQNVKCSGKDAKEGENKQASKGNSQNSQVPPRGTNSSGSKKDDPFSLGFTGFGGGKPFNNGDKRWIYLGMGGGVCGILMLMTASSMHREITWKDFVNG